jgi:hypothetical protein
MKRVNNCEDISTKRGTFVYPLRQSGRAEPSARNGEHAMVVAKLGRKAVEDVRRVAVARQKHEWYPVPAPVNDLKFDGRPHGDLHNPVRRWTGSVGWTKRRCIGEHARPLSCQSTERDDGECGRHDNQADRLRTTRLFASADG